MKYQSLLRPYFIQRRATTFLIAAGLLFSLAGAGCSKKSRLESHIKRAHEFHAKAELDRAEIEYLNALKLDPQNIEAITRLGLLYYSQGAVTRAIPFLLQAREVNPDNLEIRMKSAMFQVTVTADRVKAMADVKFVLSKDPANREAILFLADTVGTPAQAAEARATLSSLPRTAVTITAEALILLREGNVAQGEKLLLEAQALDPKFDKTYSSLSAIAVVKKDIPKAVQLAEKAAELTPDEPGNKILVARFKLAQDDVAGAKQLLKAMTETRSGSIQPRMMLAEIYAFEQNFQEAHAALAYVLGRDPLNPEAFLMRARIFQMQGKLDKAKADLERLLATFPGHTPALLQYARVLKASGDSNAAVGQLNKILTVNPNSPEAGVLMAEIQIEQKNAPAAVVTLTQVLKASNPPLRAALLLAEAYRMQGRMDDALAIMQKLERDFPTQDQFPMMRGLLMLERQDYAAARAGFARAVEIAPKNAAAIEQLNMLDLRENKAEAALARVEAALAGNANDAALLIMKGRIQLASGKVQQAEATLRQAISVQPENRAGYLVLAQLYMTQRNLAKAVENLESVVAQNPKDVSALMLIGSLHEQAGNADAAKVTYEKLIQVDPKFAPALNNLACLYAEKFNRLDEAHALATRAREAKATDPFAADTLGWILYRKGEYKWALGLVRESAEQLSMSAEIQYHLGMIHYAMGEEDASLRAFEKALSLEATFTGKPEVESRLALLKLSPDATDAASKALLEKHLAANPADPIALARLAQMDFRTGKLEDARAGYEKILKTNGANLAALKGIARVHVSGKNWAKALEVAQSARKISAEDPEIAMILADAAWGKGDRKYGYILYQEAARKLPGNADAAYALAEAAFSQGRIQDAILNWTAALQLAPAHASSVRARESVALLRSYANAAFTPEQLQTAGELMKKNDANVAARLVLGAQARRSGQGEQSRKLLEQALSIYPECVPVMRELALLLVDSTPDAASVLDWATKARELAPQDKEIARVLGMLAFRRNEFQRAETLLAESVSGNGEALTYFYLGKAQMQVKGGNGRANLKKALEMGLDAKSAEEARQLIGEGK